MRQLNPVTDSKTVMGEAYDTERQVLTLQYKNGFHYEYSNVTPEIAANFAAADSKGGWIAANLTGKGMAERHPFTKVTPPPETEE